jgi:4-diphosphocytidyl-2-C-methyl-D-erythritol kinase
VAALLALERALKKSLSGADKLRIAAAVGSDLPLFLIGGTALGVGRGEEVYPLPDLPSTCCVVATPEIGVSTPKAFADWDAMVAKDVLEAAEGDRPHAGRAAINAKLTGLSPSDRMSQLSRALSAWLSGQPLSGVPVSKGRGRAETSLLDLVRTGIENDFEQVVFPKYPELREVKSVFERSGAFYASLSGSGSALYGLFKSQTAGKKAAIKLRQNGITAVATSTLARRLYWKKFLVSGF